MKKRTFVYVLMVVLYLSLAACASSDEGQPSGAIENIATNPLPTPEIAENDDTVVGFEGTISGKYFDISILDAKWTDALEVDGVGVPMTVTPQKDGTKLLCLIFSAKNTAEEIENLGMFNAYVDKQTVLPTTFLGKVDDAIVFVGAVESGMEMKAYQVWELPENWEEFQLKYFEATGPECAQHFVIHPEDIGAE